MRIENIKPKINIETAIPDELIGFFRKVQYLIEQSDESVIIPSDYTEKPPT